MSDDSIGDFLRVGLSSPSSLGGGRLIGRVCEELKKSLIERLLYSTMEGYDSALLVSPRSKGVKRDHSVLYSR